MQSKTIKRVLIANRGEIAVRIIKTCRKLAIEPIAIYSDIDKNSLFVQMASEAYPLNGNEAGATYLNQDKILQICLENRIDAVHPGYGFLSENAKFAELLAQYSIGFIGPSAQSIRLMGDKVTAIQKMQENGVPTVPGFHALTDDISIALAEAKKIGFPVLIKASAGGGGKGMKKVEKEQEFAALYESARREAGNFFSDDRVFIEKYLEQPRHIEFQIFADSHGNTIHLYERDCSVQRRHQKIIEETPAQISDALRAKMARAALQAAQSISYLGAGTVEFIVDKNENFYFLEMNTRLQVEHPVTEMITGLDLVELQIQVARGQSLSDIQPEIKGHSMEVRIYAEDPQNEFLPDTGKIHLYQQPIGRGVRVDSGIQNGSEVSIYYDPMLAKLIVHDDRSRRNAIETMKTALQNYVILGVKTNINYLINLLQNENFQKGSPTTHFIQQYGKIDLDTSFHPFAAATASFISALLYCKRPKYQTLWSPHEIQTEPPFTYQLQEQYLYNSNQWLDSGQKITVTALSIEDNQTEYCIQWQCQTPKKQETITLKFSKTMKENIIYLHNNENVPPQKIFFYRYGYQIYLFTLGKSYKVEYIVQFDAPVEEAKNNYKSPMPAKVLKIIISEKQQVKKGQTLLILEAMKMENEIKAHSDGFIEKIHVEAGGLVSQGQILLELQTDS